MKLTDLKPGDKVKHYCSGEIVEGTVIDNDGTCIKTSHEPVRWGNDYYTTTFILPSSQLQVNAGYAETTPKAWFNNQLITL